MFQNFTINKRSGTYAETLEAFGLMNLIYEIFERNSISFFKITVEDKGAYFSVQSNKEITNDLIKRLGYFPILKFIIKDSSTEIPQDISQSDCYDYPAQKAIQDEYKKDFENIEKNKELAQEQKKNAKKALNEKKKTEFGQKVDPQFDVYREIKKNPYASFTKLFGNFHQNQEQFHEILGEILSYYSQGSIKKRSFKLIDENPTAQQLFNPSQGKGLNKTKANNASMGNLKSNWISETMKISGALSIMTAQYIKVGTSYDLKIYVPEFNNTSVTKGKELLTEFKRHLKSTSPIKLDIFNILDLIVKFIQCTPQYNKGKVRNTIRGFHSVYQKDLGQNWAVANISFINTPDFVEYRTKEEGKEWIAILESQKESISGIEELGDAIKGLQAYREFLGSTGHSALESFSKFSHWYAGYLMQALDREKYYVKPFKEETLTKFYAYMEPNLKEIINNEGFKAVANAIRKSTVSLQYTPKGQRKFEIRYGLSQQLQNKSKSKEDLATFIGDFATTYNAETGRYVEKIKSKSKDEETNVIPRANIKDAELDKFYELLNENPPRLIGALLASYGFALTAKEAPDKPESETQILKTNN